MKILVVLTGGTIGSRISDNLIDVDDTSCYMLINKYRSEYGDDIDFDVINPINILSENLRPKYWKQLYQGIREALDRNKTAETPYDGIIVTHGSDTLAYTSAFLGYAFRDLEIPMLITAANYPLEDVRSNGLSNFAGCVDFISSPLRGVFTLFKNDRDESVVYLSTRLREAEGFKDQFSPFGNEPYGWMNKGLFVFNDKDINPGTAELNRNEEAGFDAGLVNLDFPNEVVLIHSYPGQNYSNFDFDAKVKAVCLVMYHSSTTCTGEDDYSVTKLLKKCSKKGIDVYLCPFKELNSRMYASSSTFLTDEVNTLLNIGPEAAYVKCLLAYNQNETNPRELMNKTLFYEILKR